MTPKKGNKKTFLKLEAKISAIKSYLDSEVSAFSKKNALSKSIDLKAMEEKQEKTIQNLE